MTNDKTVTMSRELAERISARLERLNAGFCELRALLAAPVVECQEPVAWMALNRDGFPEKCFPLDPEGFPVYRSPPAPVAHQEPVAYMRNEGTPNNLVKCTFTCPGAFGVYEHPAPKTVVNLRNFANAMIDIALEGADADGAQIQELAVEHGLLKPEQRTERCGDTCSCAEYAGFPVECFRKVKELNQ